MRRFSVLAVALLAASCGGENNDEPSNNGTSPDSGVTTQADMGSGSGDAGEAGDTGGAGDMGSDEPDAGEQGFALPNWDELDDGWNEIYPGGGTSCALGQEWSFYVYKGDPTKLTVHYFGGGACWNEATCNSDVYTDEIDSLREQINAGNRPGIFEMDNPDNPVNGWTQIVVPYCTGDIHWGDALVEYGVGTVVEHRGAVNARSVLEFAENELSGAQDVFIHGCSAGAYGAVMWAPHYMEKWPNATHTMFADSGAGVITDDFFRNSFPQWNANPVFPNWIPALDPSQIDVFALTPTDLYREIGAFYPDARLSQWNTEFDESQTLFYTLMGGQDANEWSNKMYDLTHGIIDSTPNYLNWTAAGNVHCTLPLTRFYQDETNGVKLTDWLSDMLARDENIDHVACEDCRQPPQ